MNTSRSFTRLFNVFRILVVLTMLFSQLGWAVGHASATPVYCFVDADATAGANTGDSWENAFTDLQSALGGSTCTEVWVADGTYKPTSGTDRSATFLLKDGVGLYGGFAGSETTREERDWQTNFTILSGDIGTSSDNSHNSYHVVTGATGATLDGFTVTAGNANGGGTNNFGGGMFNDSSSPTLTNVTFSENSAAYMGGGIYSNGGTMTLSASTVTGNTAGTGGGIYNNGDLTINTNSVISENNGISDWGGGIFNDTSGHAIMDASVITKNWSYSGGGVYNQGTLIIRNGSSVIQNRATYDGAGIYTYTGGTTTVDASTVNTNNASWGGGFFNGGTLHIQNASTVSGNVASFGGGIHNGGGYENLTATLTIDASTINSNQAKNGGGILNSIGTITITGSTFTGNSAEDDGGGIHNDANANVTNSTFSINSATNGGGISNNGSIVVTNSTFAENSASSQGGNIFNDSAFTLHNTIIANSPSGGNCSGGITDGGGNLVWGDTSCPGSNADPKLGPLTDNGGPTQTMALPSGSAAIDSVVTNCPATDQRGIARPQGAHCDIGAYEKVSFIGPTFTVEPNSPWIAGRDWTVGNMLTLTVDNDTDPGNGVLHVDSQTVAGDGTVQFYMPSDFALEPYQFVTLDDGVSTKSMRIADLHFDTINESTNTAIGRGPANQPITVGVTTDTAAAGLNFFIGEDGNWYADFSGSLDIHTILDGSAQIFDDDGDATLVHLEIPNFSARFPEKQVHGYNWRLDTDVTISIDDPSGPDYPPTTQKVIVADWDPNQTFVQFMLNDVEGFELKPGQTVSMTDGYITKVLTVNDLKVTGIDVDLDTVSGLADPGTYVEVGHICDNTGCAIRRIWADDSLDPTPGAWVADFGHPTPGSTNADELLTMDIKPGTGSEARASDIDSDTTIVQWRIPNPHIEADPVGHWVNGSEWPDSPVHLMVERGIGNMVYNVTGGPWFGLWGPPQFDLTAGDIITLSSTGLTRSMTVAPLEVTGMDVDADTVSGTASTSAEVHVWVNGQPEQTVTATGGNWTAHIASLNPGNDGGAREYDVNGNFTQTDWHVPNPHIQANPIRHWLNAYDWPDMPVHLKVERGGEVILEVDSSSGNFDLWDPRYDLQAGDVLTVSSVGLTRIMTVGALAVNVIDASANTVSGTADDGVEVHVWVNGGPGVTVTATGGVWTANFNDFGTFDLAPGMGGGAQEYDENGNFTQVDWRVQNPWILAHVTANTVQAHDWPVGTLLTLTINGLGNYPGVAENTNPGDPYETYAAIGVPDGFHTGDVLHIAGGGVEKTYTVTPLQVTGFDLIANTLSGKAMDGARVQVCVNISNGCITRWTTAAGDPALGPNWSVDYDSELADPQDDPRTYTLVPGDNGWASEPNNAGDQTWVDWHILDTRIGIDPLNRWVNVPEWPGTPIHLTIQRGGEPLYDVLGGTGQLNFTLWDPRIDLQAGDIITLEGGGLTRSMTVPPLAVTGIDAGTDTISGTASAGASVVVWINVGPNMTVTATGGNWTAHFADFDLLPGMDGGVYESDSEGNTTQIEWRVQKPWIQAYVNGNWVQAYEWPQDAWLTMTINGAGDYTAQAGNIQLNDPYNTRAYFEVPDGVHAGDILDIQITGGGVEKTYTVAPFEVTGMDVGTNTISGKATDGARVQVCVNLTNDCISRWVTAAGDPALGPNWSVDYDSELADPQDDPRTWTLKPEDNGWAAEFNANGDQTWTGWRIPNPHIQVNPIGHWVNAYDWPLNTWVTMTIAGSGGPYSDTAQVIHNPDNPGDPNDIRAWFNLWTQPYDLQPGDVVSMVGGGITESMTVMALDVSVLDAANDLVSGTGVEGAAIHVWVNGGPNLNFTVGPGVNWTANFSPFDLKPGMDGGVQEYDSEGNLTQFDWRILNPNFYVRANNDVVEAYEWPLGNAVTLTVDNPGTSENPDYTSLPITVGEASWDPSQTYAEFNLWEVFDIQPGFVVSMTDTFTTKTMTVSVLSFSSVNIDTDVVAGIASPNVRVNAWACNWSGCYNRHATSDGAGNWSVDFFNLGSEGNEQVRFNIVNDTWIDSEELDALDNNGDRTRYGINVLLPTIEASVGSHWVHARGNWPDGTLITMTIDDPDGSDYGPVMATFGQNPGDPKDWLADFDLDSYDLQAYQVITMTGAGITKTYTIQPLQVTGYDLIANTISGSGLAGHQLQVCVNNMSGNCSRHISVGPGNTWMADYGQGSPTRPDEQDLADLQPGSNGWVADYEDDGDQTWVDWSVPNPNISIPLVIGWNLVSFRLHPTSTAITDVLASLGSNYDLVYAWDASGGHAGAGNWMRYAPGIPGNSLETLDETQGFWIRMTGEDNLDITGTVPTTTNISLPTNASGWNLVGYPSDETRGMPEALETHGVTAYTLVYAYHANDSDTWKRYAPGVPGNDLLELAPGWGYWIKVSAPSIWDVEY